MTFIPNNYRIVVPLDVVPEEGDTLEGLVAFVKDLGNEWLPEESSFLIQYEDENGLFRTAEVT